MPTVHGLHVGGAGVTRERRENALSDMASAHTLQDGLFKGLRSVVAAPYSSPTVLASVPEVGLMYGMYMKVS